MESMRSFGMYLSSSSERLATAGPRRLERGIGCICGHGFNFRAALRPTRAPREDCCASGFSIHWLNPGDLVAIAGTALKKARFVFVTSSIALIPTEVPVRLDSISKRFQTMPRGGSRPNAGRKRNSEQATAPQYRRAGYPQLLEEIGIQGKGMERRD